MIWKSYELRRVFDGDTLFEHMHDFAGNKLKTIESTHANQILFVTDYQKEIKTIYNYNQAGRLIGREFVKTSIE